MAAGPHFASRRDELAASEQAAFGVSGQLDGVGERCSPSVRRPSDRIRNRQSMVQLVTETRPRQWSD
jgi:hypothetical protein